ncbi:MAG: 30S ribosomal protein S6 [Candidatus Hadarchaeum sp.]
MPQYELVFVVRPELEEEPLAALVNKVSQTISDLQGQVQQIEPWGKRRLAYPIKKYREGFYYLMLIELPASAVRSLDRTLRFTEDVIRHLIVRKDEKSG